MNFVAIPACYLHFYLPVFSPRKSAPGRPGRKVKDLGSECTRQNKATRCQGRSYPSAWMDAAGAEGWGSKAQVLSSNILRGGSHGKMRQVWGKIMGKEGWYPLVMTNMAIENGHL